MSDEAAIDFEIAFYEGVLALHPEYVDVLKILGDLYTKRGFLQKGLAVDLQLIRLRPSEPLVFYNLACSLALTGESDDAFRVLERAFQLGYREWRHMETDHDLDPIRDDPRYDDLLRRMQAEETGGG